MKTKNILALLLAFVLVFALLVGCTATSETKKDDTKKEDKTQSGGEEQETENYDFDQEEFYFVCSPFPKDPDDYTQEEIDNDEKPTSYSLVDEAKLNRLLDTEKEFNCQIRCIEMPADNSAEIAIKVANGDTQIDIFYWDSTTLRDLFKGGLVADLNDIEAIDLTDEAKWGGATILKNAQCDGAQYGVPYVGSRYMPYLSYFYGILIQKDSAFESYETDWTVWELVDDNSWTWEKFLEILPEVSSDDKWDPKYGLAVNATYLINACLAVNEASAVVWDDELEKYVYGYTSEATQEAIEFVRDLYSMKVVCKSTNSINSFNNDMYTFVLSNGYRVFGDYPNIVTSGSYSWIPFPYGPHSIYGESTASYGLANCETLTSVFKGSAADENPDEETQRNGIIFNALVDELPIGDYANYEEYALHNLWEKNDTKGWSVYQQYASSIHSPYRDELGDGLLNSINAKLNACCDDSSFNIGDTMGSLEAAVNNRLDEEMNH